MRKRMLVLVCCVLVGVLLPILAQDEEALESLKKAEAEKKFLEAVRAAIESVKKDRQVLKAMEWRIFDIGDIATAKIPSFTAPQISVVSPEEGREPMPITVGGEWEDDTGLWDTATLIEWIRLKTGEENWEIEGSLIAPSRNLLVVRNTRWMLDKVESLLQEVRSRRREYITLHIYLIEASEGYIKALADETGKVLSPESVKRLMRDLKDGGDVELLRGGIVSCLNGQGVYVFDGASHTYKGDCDTSGTGGLTPVEIYDPIISTLIEGFIVEVATLYSRSTQTFSLNIDAALAKFLGLEEKTATGGLTKLKTFKIEVPKMDIQRKV